MAFPLAIKGKQHHHTRLTFRIMCQIDKVLYYLVKLTTMFTDQIQYHPACGEGRGKWRNKSQLSIGTNKTNEIGTNFAKDLPFEVQSTFVYCM